MSPLVISPAASGLVGAVCLRPVRSFLVAAMSRLERFFSSEVIVGFEMDV